MTDLLNILTAFDRVSTILKMPLVYKTIVESLPESIKNSDRDLLALFEVFHRVKLLEHERYEHLIHFVQDYAASRFEFMDKLVVLEFAKFLLKIGLWQWDQNLMTQIEHHFTQNYVEYQVDSMCKIVKLVGNNFQRSESLLSLIEDSIRMRLNHMIKNEKNTEDYITIEGIRNLTEGLDAYGSLVGTKRLMSLVKTMVILAHREDRPLLKQDAKLLTQVVRLLSDFQVKPGSELFEIVQEAIRDPSFTPSLD